MQDNRMGWIRYLETPGQADGSTFLEDWEIASECRITGKLVEADGKLIFSPDAFEPDDAGLYKYVIRFCYPMAVSDNDANFGQRFHLRLGIEQPAPAHDIINAGERIAAFVASLSKGADGLIKQPHQASDIARAGAETPFFAFVGFGEQRTDQFVEHLDGGVRKPRFEIDGLGGERGPAAALAVVAQQECRRDRSFTRKLPEPVFMDAEGPWDRSASYGRRSS